MNKIKRLKSKVSLFKIGFVFSSALIFIALVLGVFVYFQDSKTAEAISSCSMEGFAWSGIDSDADGLDGLPDEGVGWISFSSNTFGSGGGGPYFVNVEINGDMVGYAWSSNIGWIRFGGLSGFPLDGLGGTTAVNARSVDLWPPPTSTSTSVMPFEGWARACAVYQNGCDGAIRPDYERGGWDGWISLKGSSVSPPFNYSVKYDNGTERFRGWAYGGPINLGWISFSDDTIDSGGGGPYAVTIPNANDPGQCLAQNPFDYDFSVETPINWPYPGADPFIVPANSTITGLTDNDGSITVSLTDVQIDPNGNQPPAGVQITQPIWFNLSPCTPDPDSIPCIRQIRVTFDLSGYSGGDFPVDFIATANTNNNNLEKTSNFTIVIIIPPPPSANACTANPSVAIINQDVSWSAPTNPPNAPVFFNWFHTDDINGNNPLPFPSPGTGNPITESYDEFGTIFSFVEMCEDDGSGNSVNCADSDICSVAIILNPEFEPF